MWILMSDFPFNFSHTTHYIWVLLSTVVFNFSQYRQLCIFIFNLSHLAYRCECETVLKLVKIFQTMLSHVHIVHPFLQEHLVFLHLKIFFPLPDLLLGWQAGCMAGKWSLMGTLPCSALLCQPRICLASLFSPHYYYFTLAWTPQCFADHLCIVCGRVHSICTVASEPFS